MLTVRRKDVPEPMSADAPASDGSNMRRALFVGAMIVWIALIPVLGFLVASIVGYFTIMAVAMHERMPLKQIVALVVLGAAILAGFYLLMANVLLIPMPRGQFF